MITVDVDDTEIVSMFEATKLHQTGQVGES